MIFTNNLSKQFDEFLAVDDVTLKVGAGEVLALLGPNGAGKTTTVRMLTSVLRPTRGSARVAGFDIITQAQQVRAHVGVLTENHGLYNRMPAEDYLDFYGQIYQQAPEIRQRRIQELLEHFSLPIHSRKQIGEYSKGMRQKLALARALLHDPPVLLLDEPTSAMDPESARLVRDAIRNLRSAERAIIICTHNLAEAEELADQIAIIRRGRIIALGSPQSLKARLLGPAEYELRLARNLNGVAFAVPPGSQVTTRGDDWVRFRVDDPAEGNPLILRSFLEQGLPVIGLQEVPRSLEQVYLQAIAAPDDLEAIHAK
ncbi:MAG: ABC transporter ATP-binding protein [Anaerolineales bacterium]|nr:ABC transporter ATP-binding protein [Anaerolineales bacterium]